MPDNGEQRLEFTFHLGSTIAPINCRIRGDITIVASPFFKFKHWSNFKFSEIKLVSGPEQTLVR